MSRKPEFFNKDDYCTPPEVLALVYAAIGVPELDPCSNERSLVVSKHAFCPDKIDGLKTGWGETSTVYMNPPYSNTSQWVEKFLSWSGRGFDAHGGPTQGVMLLSAETGLVWWQQRLLGNIDRWIFLPRIAFLAAGEPVYGNRCNSVMIYVGDEGKRVAQVWPKPVFRPCR
ncbi:MAG: DNA N-6-adenine-methyltransferase [Acidimicrobiia bacterium]